MFSRFRSHGSSQRSDDSEERPAQEANDLARMAESMAAEDTVEKEFLPAEEDDLAEDRPPEARPPMAEGELEEGCTEPQLADDAGLEQPVAQPDTDAGVEREGNSADAEGVVELWVRDADDPGLLELQERDWGEERGEAAEETDDDELEADAAEPDRSLRLPPPTGPRPRGRRLERKGDYRKPIFSAEQRLLILDCWRRSGLPAKDFAPLVGVSRHTIYAWRKRFDEEGAAGLADQPRKRRSGSRLPEAARRAILLLKQSHPDWGCQRISDMLLRVSALSAGPDAVARVLKQAGYERVEERTRPNPPKPRRFERARPNQLWQTDLFTFVLKRQNRRVHLTAMLDDHSRFITGYGLSATANTSLVIETLEAAIASHGAPEELLTDNGPQYVTWRGVSRLTKHLRRRGIRQIVARPKRPQTLGKIERFWGTMWREMLETAVFLDLEDARRRIGLFIDYYNLQRTHRGIDGATPADRYFHAAVDVLAALQARAATHSLELSRHGQAAPFYLTGQLGGRTFTVHGEGGAYVLMCDGRREQLDLTGPPPAEPLAAAAWQAASQAAADVERSAATAPKPLCPDGSPAQPASEAAEAAPLQPGESPLDDLFESASNEERSSTSEDAASNDKEQS